MPHTILVTGGAGYIGSHTAWLLAQKGHHVVVLDKLVYNQRGPQAWTTFFVGDCGDAQLLDTIFSHTKIDAVMHFAASIEVGESVKNPSTFYHNNVINTITLLDCMHAHGVNNIIFSSSCAVYGEPQFLPLTEQHPKNPISPYGKTKWMMEQVMQDYAQAYGLQYVALRYFNAAGALPECGLGEQHEPETHIIPLVLRAAKTNTPFKIFGDDYDTPDGTCIRDYVHVLDIADAHVRALDHLLDGKPSDAFNLGTGAGYSVRQIIDTVARVCGIPVTTTVIPRRPGDPPQLIADPSKAFNILGWRPQHSDLAFIIRSAHVFDELMTTQKGQTLVGKNADLLG